MIAVDANTILRAVLEDDPVQTPVSQRVLSEEELFIPLTVLLEVEWTLRRREKLSGRAISAGLQKLFGQSNVTLQESDAVAAALEWTKRGVEIADALHLANSVGCSALLTFDVGFITAAAAVGGIPVRQP